MVPLRKLFRTFLWKLCSYKWTVSVLRPVL